MSVSFWAAVTTLEHWRARVWFGYESEPGALGRFGWARQFYGPNASAKAAEDRHRAAQAEARDRRRAEQLDDDERLGLPREAAP